MTSVFATYLKRNYPYQFAGVLHLESIAGGVPLDPAVLERHISTKVAASDDLIRTEVMDILAERAEAGETPDVEKAIEEAAKMKGLVGFLKDPTLGYYIPGANFKAGIVEAACIAAAEGRIDARGWGKTNKGIKSWLVEHMFVIEHKLPLGVDEPTEVPQSFIHKVLPGRGPVSAIQYTEVVRDCEIHFTLESDHNFKDEQWAAIWLTAERTGFGAARKRGYGTGEVTRWDRVTDDAPSTAASNGKATGKVAVTA